MKIHRWTIILFAGCSDNVVPFGLSSGNRLDMRVSIIPKAITKISEQLTAPPTGDRSMHIPQIDSAFQPPKINSPGHTEEKIFRTEEVRAVGNVGKAQQNRASLCCIMCIRELNFSPSKTVNNSVGL
jgi:hypothetical protein